MLKSIIFFLLSIVALFSYADETKRWNIIKDIVNKELGSNTYVQTIESNFQDSINVQPYDSVCIQQAIRAWDGFIDFASNFAEFKVYLFPNSDKYSPSGLSTDNLVKYQLYTTSMRNSLNEYRRLIELINAYVPYQTRRVNESYEVKNGDGKILEYRAIYFFNDNDDLERYFWFDKMKEKNTVGMIELARNHDFQFIETALERLNVKFDPEFMTYLISSEDTEYNKTEIQKLKTQRKSQIKRQSIKKGQAYSKTTSSATTNGNYNSKTSSQSSIRQVGTSHTPVYDIVQYVVTKEVCGATYTKDAMKRYTKFAINDNYKAINFMILSGELIVLRRGQVVTMLDHGFLLSYIMLSNGWKVYTDTENLTKKL